MQLNHMITEQACRFIQILSLQKGKSEKSLRFFLYFLLFSCLQLWRLMASTPGGEELLKYVCEEGTRFVDEVIEEEDSINHQPLLNVAQTTSHTDEERRVFIVASPLNIHSIADSTSSSLFSEVNPESTPNQQRQQRIDNSMTGKALSVCCERWLAETGSVDGVSYVSNCITHGADHGLVRAFEKYRSNVIKAHNLGDDALALSWIQVAEDIQQAIEASIKHAEAYQNLELYCHPQSVYDGLLAKEAHFMTLYGINRAWENACYAMEEIAEYREKYIKTSMISQIPENIPPDMKEKKKIIEQLEFVANYLKKAAEAYSVGKEQEYNCFKSVAQSMQESIYGLKAAARAKEENQRELEALWFKTVDCYEEITKYYDQAANIWSSENTTECSHIDQIKEFTKEAYLNNIPNFLQPKLKDENRLLPICNNNADRLQRAARALKKSLDNSDPDDAEISAFWRRVAEQYQLVVELNIQATQEEIQGNKEEATRLKEAANIAEDAVTSTQERIDCWLGEPPISCYSSLLCKTDP